LVVLGEVVEDTEQALAPALVAGPGLGYRVVRGGEVIEEPMYLSRSQLRELLVDPLTQRL
jgi:hypothetical protein